MRGYRIVDYLTQGYLAVVGLLVLFFHGESVPHWLLYVVLHLGLMLVVHGLIQLDLRLNHRILGLLRCFYPMILYTFFYLETHGLDTLFVHGYLDDLFIALDRKIFGCLWSSELAQRLPYAWLGEVLYLAYFSYYVMVPGVGLALYLRHRARFFRYLTVVSLVFYLCYLIYIFLPVMGPHAISSIERQVPDAIRAGLFFNVMRIVYAHCEPEGGAAFPSSHVAVAIVTVCFTWERWKRLRWIHLLAVALLSAATVYCGYHYVVDVIGGIVTAAVLIPVGHLIYRKTDGLRDDAAQRGRPGTADRARNGAAAGR